MLTPTRIYVSSLLKALRSGKVKGAAHITGGGIPGNLERILPGKRFLCCVVLTVKDHCSAMVDLGAWHLPPIFNWIASVGCISVDELLKTFNCGIGVILVVAASLKEEVISMLADQGEQVVHEIGRLQRSREERVNFINENLWCNKIAPCAVTSKKVAVLISGSGTNLQALIDASRDPQYGAEIKLVVSNVSDAFGLKRAEAAGIPTAVIPHQEFKTRANFDAQLDKVLTDHNIEIICLAGILLTAKK